MNKLASVANALHKADKIIISGHITPDGDSIGSTLALGLALEKIGKKVTMTVPDEMSDTYAFLPGANRLQRGLPFGCYDTFVVLDCSVPERLGEELQPLLKRDVRVIVIDHHVSEDFFADVNYIDSKAAATGEIIYDLLQLMKVELDLDIAVNLYTAIVTDTGSFKYEGTTSLTHRRIADLLDVGVPVAQLSKQIFDQKPFKAFKILEKALSTLSLSECGQVAWITVDYLTRQTVGISDEHTDNLVNYPRRIKGVEVALFFKEVEPGVVKISMRSNYFVDVNKLAAEFNGGGHRRASGCTIKGNLEEIRNAVVEAAINAVQRGS